MIKTIILIPSRLSATRLPGKPLLKINGISIISHVVKKAKKADIGEVYVATEDKEILEDVNSNGGKAMQWDHKYDSLLSLIFILCCLPIFNSQNPNILLPAMNFSSETKMYHKVNLGSRLILLLMRCLMSFFYYEADFHDNGDH